jgi:hypothetical protein
MGVFNTERKTTIKEATEHWVRGFNVYHQSFIEKAYPYMEEITELTPLPKKYVCDECFEKFDKDFFDEIEEDEYGDKPCTNEDCGVVEEQDNEDELEYGLPMWSYLWNPDEILDEGWIIDNLEIVAECGFRIYETEEIGVFIGIDGAGYDFYESHWIPLYKARGLKWHDVE